MGQISNISNAMMLLARWKIHSGEISCTDNLPHCSTWVGYLRYVGLYIVIAHVYMSKVKAILIDISKGDWLQSKLAYKHIEKVISSKSLLKLLLANNTMAMLIYSICPMKSTRGEILVI